MKRRPARSSVDVKRSLPGGEGGGERDDGEQPARHGTALPRAPRTDEQDLRDLRLDAREDPRRLDALHDRLEAPGRRALGEGEQRGDRRVEGQAGGRPGDGRGGRGGRRGGGGGGPRGRHDDREALARPPEVARESRLRAEDLRRGERGSGGMRTVKGPPTAGGGGLTRVRASMKLTEKPRRASGVELTPERWTVKLWQTKAWPGRSSTSTTAPGGARVTSSSMASALSVWPRCERRPLRWLPRTTCDS